MLTTSGILSPFLGEAVSLNIIALAIGGTILHKRLVNTPIVLAALSISIFAVAVLFKSPMTI